MTSIPVMSTPGSMKWATEFMTQLHKKFNEGDEITIISIDRTEAKVRINDEVITFVFEQEDKLQGYTAELQDFIMVHKIKAHYYLTNILPPTEHTAAAIRQSNCIITEDESWLKMISEIFNMKPKKRKNYKSYLENLKGERHSVVYDPKSMILRHKGIKNLIVPRSLYIDARECGFLTTNTFNNPDSKKIAEAEEGPARNSLVAKITYMNHTFNHYRNHFIKRGRNSGINC